MSEQQFRLYRYKRAIYRGVETLGIENSKDPGRVYGMGVYREGEPLERAYAKLRDFRNGSAAWPDSAFLFDWRDGVEIPVDESDWEQKYNDLVVNLEAAAREHGLCSQWDDFKRDNGIVAPTLPIPEEPQGYGAVVEFEGRVPAYRGGYKGQTWKFTTMNREFTWEELVKFCDHEPFKILYDES